MARQSWTEGQRVMTLRRRSVFVDRVVMVTDGFRRHRSGRNAALIAHYGFLSVFPLVLTLTTILGFVLQGRPGLQDRIIDSALAQLPIVGQQISIDPSALRGNAVVLVLGLLAAIWSGTKAFTALYSALDDIDEVHLDDRSNFAVVRVRAVGGIAVVGGAQVASAISTSLIGATDLPAVSKVLLMVAAATINTAVLGFTYRWLCTRRAAWRDVLPGAVLAGLVFSGLQLIGTTVVARAIANASPVYGTFASVIAVLSWLSLHTTVALIGAEINRVGARARLTGG